MIIRLAKILSLIFHPLWMPLIIYILVRWLDPYYIAPTQADNFVLLLLVVNIIAPAVSILIMIKYGLLSDIELRNRKERFGPYLLVIFYYILSYTMLKWKGPILPPEVFSFFVSVILSLVVSLTINMFWKISVHLLAQGGVFGTLLALNSLHKSDITVFLMLSAIGAGLTAYSRLKLDAHTHGQVYAGFCLGACMNWLVISQKFMI
jgi:membrane-associated phospholipid phosphatase